MRDKICFWCFCSWVITAFVVVFLKQVSPAGFNRNKRCKYTINVIHHKCKYHHVSFITIHSHSVLKWSLRLAEFPIRVPTNTTLKYNKQYLNSPFLGLLLRPSRIRCYCFSNSTIRTKVLETLNNVTTNDKVLFTS